MEKYKKVLLTTNAKLIQIKYGGNHRQYKKPLNINKGIIKTPRIKISGNWEADKYPRFAN